MPTIYFPTMVLNWFGKRNCVICYVIFVFWWSMGNDQHVCIFCWQITWIITLLFNRTLSHVTDRYRFFFLMKTVSYNSLSLQNIWWNYNMPNQTVLHFEQSWSKNGTEADLSILKKLHVYVYCSFHQMEKSCQFNNDHRQFRHLKLLKYYKMF